MYDDQYIIRDYRSADYAGLTSLWTATGVATPERGDRHEIIMDTIEMGGSLLIMENQNDGTVIGSSWLTNDGRRIHLHHFAIDPAYQGRGLGKRMMSASMQIVRKCGLQVKIEVENSNTRALSFYKKWGFKSLGNYGVHLIRDLDACTDPDV